MCLCMSDGSARPHLPSGSVDYNRNRQFYIPRMLCTYSGYSQLAAGKLTPYHMDSLVLARILNPSGTVLVMLYLYHLRMHSVGLHMY